MNGLKAAAVISVKLMMRLHYNGVAIASKISKMVHSFIYRVNEINVHAKDMPAPSADTHGEINNTK